MINAEYIKALNPCQDRLDNYLKYYEKFDSSLLSFLDLDNISHQDKLWVFFRSIPKNRIPLVAADIADLVLDIYEKQYPNDDRPRKAIAAARSGDAAAYAAATAAYAAYAATVAYAANAAYAAYAAATAAYAAYAATAANAAYAAYAAAAYSDRTRMEKQQLSILKKWAEL